MRITQRQSVLGLLGLGTLIVLIVLPFRIFTSAPLVEIAVVVVALVAFASLFIAYWRGWEAARYILVLTITGLTIADARNLQDIPHIGSLIAPILALVIANPFWVIGSGALIYTTILLQGVISYRDPVNILTYVMAIGGLVVSRLVIETVAHSAEENARRAVANGQRAEEESQIAQRRAEELSVQNEQQRQLIALVATLETPTVSLADRVLFAPIVGQLDSRRAQSLTRRLLEVASQQRAHLLILDITGVSAVDTQVAQALMRTTQALNLLGCQVSLTGISPTVATTITDLGITFDTVQVSRTPQEALAHYNSQRM
jgi:rsbT co-antagonist protein RsbR